MYLFLIWSKMFSEIGSLFQNSSPFYDRTLWLSVTPFFHVLYYVLGLVFQKIMAASHTFFSSEIIRYERRKDMKFGFERHSVFCGKEVWKCWIYVTLGKVQWMTLTLSCNKSSFTRLYVHLYSPQRVLSTVSLSIFPYKKNKNKKWPNLTLQ